MRIWRYRGRWVTRHCFSQSSSMHCLAPQFLITRLVCGRFPPIQTHDARICQVKDGSPVEIEFLTRERHNPKTVEEDRDLEVYNAVPPTITLSLVCRVDCKVQGVWCLGAKVPSLQAQGNSTAHVSSLVWRRSNHEQHSSRLATDILWALCS